MVNVSDFQEFNFAYTTGLILIILVFWAVIKSLFWLIFMCFAGVFAILKKRGLGRVDVALAQKVNLLRRSGYSAKSCIVAWNCDPRGGFKASHKCTPASRALKPLQGPKTKYATNSILFIIPV